jgi:hypothetical protein
MMKYLALLLFISQAYGAGDPRRCQDLSQIFRQYESQFQFKNLPECSGENTLNELQTKYQLSSEDQKKFLQDNSCKTLANIEERIANLQNEQELLAGFEKLKADILANKNSVNPEAPRNSKFAALDFMDGLNVATTLEQLIVESSGNLLKALKNSKTEDRDSAQEVKVIINQICKDNNDITSAPCRPEAFNPNQNAVEAINELLEADDLEAKISDWQQSLSITKKADESPYSFSEMMNLLKNKNEDIKKGQLSLTKEQLRAIKDLPDFQNADINLIQKKNQLQTFQRLQEFKFHTQDLKKRQEYEIQSKVSLLNNELKLPALQNVCSQASSDFNKAIECVNEIEKNKDSISSDTNKAIAGDLIESIKVSHNYIFALDANVITCLETVDAFTDENLNRGCLNALEKTPERLVQISSELLVLNVLKEKIGEQNQEQIKFRNLALQTLKNECLTSSSSELSCDLASKGISKEAWALSSDVANLLVVSNGDLDSTKKDDLCVDSNKEKFGYEALCLPPPPPSAPVVATNNPADEFEAPVVAPDGGYSTASRDAVLNGLGNLTGTILGSIFAPTQEPFYYPTTSPYAYDYGPYNGGRPLMGISDQILFNARYYGAYGYYMPTPGKQPYSSFGANKSAYFYAP